MLDHAYRAKVGDFGLARVVGGSVGGQFPPYHREGFRSREVATTVNIVGTSGYIPKEYLEGIITPKMDVYAYGVVRMYNYNHLRLSIVLLLCVSSRFFLK